MNIPEFLETIYLGDRGCKSFLLDGWNAEVKIQVTCISRVRGTSWNYYTEEDLPDGYLVFTGVSSVIFNPAGKIPNDLINEFRSECIADAQGSYLCTLRIDSVDAAANRTEVVVKIVADSLCLEDARNPGVRIID